MQAPTGQIDVLSQLQDQVNALCAKLYNFLGALQRDAPPISVKGEGLQAPPVGADVEAQTTLMATELLESFQVLEQLMQQLPNTDKTEEQQVQEIVQLQQTNSKVSQELREELSAAEALLSQLQAAFQVLADVQLARRGQARQTVKSDGGLKT